MIELLRRAILAIGVFAGLWFLAAIPPVLYKVQPVDWAAERERKQGRAADEIRTMSHELGGEKLKGIDLAPDTRGTLQEFVKSETDGRLLNVSGKDWAGFFNAVAHPSAAFKERQGRSFWNESLYFRPDEGALKGLSPLDESHSFKYVDIDDGSRVEYLTITRVVGNDLVSQAPFELLYPTRHLGWGILLGTLLAYALLPWPKVARESLRYSRVRGSILPDVIGAIVGGMFFILPVFVTNSNSNGGGIFGEGGWGYLTGICWFLGLLIASVWPIAAWFTALKLEIAPQGLQFASLTEQMLIRPTDIESVGIGRMDSPKLGRVLRFISLFMGWRAIGMALIATRPQFAYRINLKSGRSLGFADTGLIGFPQMVGWMRRQGVAIDDEVYELMNREPNDPVIDAPFPPLGKGIGMAIALLVFGAPLAFAWAKTLPSPPLAFVSEPFGSKPYVKAKDEAWVPSPELMKKEDDLLKELTQLHAQMTTLEAQLKSAPEADRARLTQEFNACFDRVQKIQEEFDKARKEAGAKD